MSRSQDISPQKGPLMQKVKNKMNKNKKRASEGLSTKNGLWNIYFLKLEVELCLICVFKDYSLSWNDKTKHVEKNLD